MLNISGTPDFPFGKVHDFTHSLYTLLNLSVLGLCLRMNGSGLFTWLSRTALSRDLFYYYLTNQVTR